MAPYIIFLLKNYWTNVVTYVYLKGSFKKRVELVAYFLDLLKQFHQKTPKKCLRLEKFTTNNPNYMDDH